METPVAPDNGDEGQAVIARFRLAASGFGDADQREQVFKAKAAMAAAVDEARVGAVDGNDFGGGEVVLYAYGPDSGAAFAAMEPTLRGLPFRPAHVVLGRGDITSRVDL